MTTQKTKFKENVYLVENSNENNQSSSIDTRNHKNMALIRNLNKLKSPCRIRRGKSRFGSDDIITHLNKESFNFTKISGEDYDANEFDERNISADEGIKIIDVHAGFKNENQLKSVLKTSEDECDCFNVLIVDDDSMCINYLQNMMQIGKKRFQTASNGNEAYLKVKKLFKKNCAICAQKRNLIILMDIIMPVLNGIEAAKLIDNYIKKKHHLEWNCKLFFISGNSDSQYRAAIQDITICRGYYSKPINKKEILSLVEEV